MRVGDWELLDCIGRGGMGVVYQGLADDGALVAVKILRAPGAPHALGRFERELRLVQLVGDSGGGFVRLLASGVHQGQPYLVMPFLPGGTLLERILRGRLPVPTVVTLGITLARTMGRAHAAGIVHRDLKPENVLFGAKDEPVIADLGLAKHFLRDAPGASRSVDISGDGTRLGTTGYMAPEQFLSAKHVGPPADVFSLGALLFECLTGESAFEGASPSEIAFRAGAGDFRSLRALRPEVPGWLVATVERCLQPRPAARFRDGDELAAALAAGGRASRRGRGLAVATVAALALGAVAVGLWLEKGSLASRGDGGTAPATSALVTPATPPLRSPSPSASPVTAPSPAGPRLPPAYAAALRGRLRLTCANVPGEPALGSAAVALGFASNERAVALGSEGTILVWDLATGTCVETLLAPGEILAGGTVAGGGVLAIGRDGDCTAWDVTSRRERLHSAGGGELRAAAVGGTGDLFLAVGGTGASIVDAATGKAVRPLGGSRAPATVALSLDGARASVAGDDGRVAVFEVATGKEVRVFGPLTVPVRSVSTDAQGRHVLTLFYRDEPAQLWEVDSGKALPSLGRGLQVRVAAFAPAGDRVVTGHADGAIRVWDVASGRPLAAIEDPSGEPVQALAVSPDGRQALSAGRDRTVRVWDLEQARCTRTLASASGGIHAIAATASGAVVALDTLQRARSLDAATGEVRSSIALGKGRMATRAAVSADGTRIAATTEEGLSFFALAEGEVSGPFPVRQHGWIAALAFTPDGRRLVATTQRDRLVAWDTAIGLELPRAERSGAAGVAPTGSWVPPRPRFVAGAPGGTRVVVAGRAGTELRDLESGEAVLSLHVVAPECGAVLPDGRRALVGQTDGRIAVVDLETGLAVGSLDGHRAAVKVVACSPDGRRALSGSLDRTLKLWDVEKEAEIDSLDLSEAPDRVTAAAFGPDGGLVVGLARGGVLVFGPRN